MALNVSLGPHELASRIAAAHRIAYGSGVDAVGKASIETSTKPGVYR